MAAKKKMETAFDKDDDGKESEGISDVEQSDEDESEEKMEEDKFPIGAFAQVVILFYQVVLSSLPYQISITGTSCSSIPILCQRRYSQEERGQRTKNGFSFSFFSFIFNELFCIRWHHC